MKYDPIKRIIGNAVRDRVTLRKLFYWILGIVFLREWHVKRELRQFLGSHSNAKVLDAGSGFGQYSYYCARNFAHTSILAVDVKEEQIQDSRRFFEKSNVTNVRFMVEDLTTTDHSEEFDLVMSVDVMEHIPDDVAVFRNLFRSLKKGGTLLVNTPSNLGGSDAHSPDDESFIGEHARNGYGVDEIRQKLQSVGFVIEKLKFTYGTWGRFGWRFGIKYPMMMLNATRLTFLVLPLYYLIVFPGVLLTMVLDYSGENQTGTGLIVLATRPKR